MLKLGCNNVFWQSSTLRNLGHLGCETDDAEDLQQIAFSAEGIMT